MKSPVDGGAAHGFRLDWKTEGLDARSQAGAARAWGMDPTARDRLFRF